MKCRLTYTLMLLLLCMANGLAAQQGDVLTESALEPIVIRGYPELEVGVRIQLLDSTAIAERYGESLAELLDREPGVFMKGYGNGGIATPTFRGTGAGHTTLFWNGLPLNSPMLGLSDFSLPAVGIIDNVDLQMGPATLKYGSGGIGGGINLLNDAVPGVGSDLTLEQQVGSFGTSHSTGRAKVDFGDVQTVTRFNYATSANDFPFANISQFGQPIETQTDAAYHRLNVLQSVQLTPNNFGRLRLHGWFYDMRRDLPPTMVTANQGERQHDRGIRTMFDWNKWFPRFVAEARGGWFREDLTYENEVAEIFSPSTVHSLMGEFQIKAWERGLQPSFRGAGLRFQRQQGSIAEFGQPRTTQVLTGHVAGSWRIVNGFSASALLRQELSEDGFSPLLGYFGLHNYLWKGLQIHANVSRNYRRPTLNDLFWVPGGNPDLRPEHSLGTEAGISQIWHSDWGRPWNSTAMLRINGYVTSVDNWILWVPGTGNVWSPENVQQVLTRGGEIALSWIRRAEKTGWDLRGSYAYARSENRVASGPADNSVGKQLIYTPEHTASMRAELQLGRNYFVVDQDLVGRRYTTRDNSSFLRGYGLSHIAAARKLRLKRSWFELRAGVRNLFNENYQVIRFRPMPRRSFFVRLRWDLLAK